MPRRGRTSATEARDRLDDALDGDRPLADALEAALEAGVDYLGVDRGFLAAVDPADEEWEAVASTDGVDGQFPPGLTLALSETYCRRVIADDDPLELRDAAEAGWADDPAFEAHGLHCYHGTRITVDGEVYGTVCFASEDPRAEPFTDAETGFTELLASKLGQLLQRREHEVELTRREQRLDVRERELREREQEYRGLLEASFDVSFRLGPEGAFVHVSESVGDLLAVPPGDLVGEHYSTVVAESGHETAGDVLGRALAGETVEASYLPLAGAAGTTVYVDVRATPLYATAAGPADAAPEAATPVPPADRTGGSSADREVVGVLAVARDATDRKRRDRLIAVLNRVLRHNLRNDMTVVRGNAQLLADDLEGEPAERARTIVETADRLVALSETAQQLERTVWTAPDLADHDVVPVVEDAVASVRASHPAATVEFDAPEAARARAAPRLRQAVEEVVENAALHAGAAPTVRVAVDADAAKTTIAVADDGPGLPADERAVLQEGEETPLEHGDGLGLWLVYWLVESLGGRVAASVDGGGTTVTLHLQRPPEDGGPAGE